MLNFLSFAVDVDEIVVNYPSMYELIHDLRAMGEGNAVMNRKGVLGRDVFRAAAEVYQGSLDRVFDNE
jgi:NADH dehydrogenase [ubiquinone] 1 alpha subcomplex assembly factor 5